MNRSAIFCAVAATALGWAATAQGGESIKIKDYLKLDPRGKAQVVGGIVKRGWPDETAQQQFVRAYYNMRCIDTAFKGFSSLENNVEQAVLLCEMMR